LEDGKFDDAERFHNFGLDIDKILLGEEHPDTLTSMNNLASTYGNQGKLREAAELQEKVLEVERMILGLEHSSTLTSMSNLAFIYKRTLSSRSANNLHLRQK
jgi:phosphoribosyl 1,2-cyclic phosphodiesterase